MHEYALMITATVSGFPGKTSKELQSMPDCWLNSMAVFSVDRILTEAENKRYVSCRSDKNNDLRYWATQKGKKEYRKYNSP